MTPILEAINAVLAKRYDEEGAILAVKNLEELCQLLQKWSTEANSSEAREAWQRTHDREMNAHLELSLTSLQDGVGPSPAQFCCYVTMLAHKAILAASEDIATTRRKFREISYLAVLRAQQLQGDDPRDQEALAEIIASFRDGSFLDPHCGRVAEQMRVVMGNPAFFTLRYMRAWNSWSPNLRYKRIVFALQQDWHHLTDRMRLQARNLRAARPR